MILSDFIVEMQEMEALGFIEKEEEPNTKWIDDAYRQYSKGISIKSQTIYSCKS